jgi:hypothetical protein
MRILVQKSLKMKLWLKHYEELKLQGLKCKSTGAGFESILKLGLDCNM